MRLNKISPGIDSRKYRARVGRGIGSALGKTCGRGHKGQKSRSGGYHKVGFEGGQMPIQRRLPKRGFVSFGKVLRIRSSSIIKIDEELINKEILVKCKLISNYIEKVKIYKNSEIDKKMTISGIRVSKGFKSAVEINGGSIL
ncbi:MAG: 50S ribosomal protein L15 [Nitrosomonas sp.]|nr:MAG: 50S ribosomal protein L15 [Nitrosomonas sp.]